MLTSTRPVWALWCIDLWLRWFMCTTCTYPHAISLSSGKWDSWAEGRPDDVGGFASEGLFPIFWAKRM